MRIFPKKRGAHLELGRRGEQLAVDYLKKKGYRIVAMNFITRLGRSITGRHLTGEIDIIAYDGEMLCFIEVKTRSNEIFATAEQAVDRRKQRQIARAARRYRQLFDLINESYRFDVVAILLCLDAQPQIRLERAFFVDPGVKKRAYIWQRYKAPD